VIPQDNANHNAAENPAAAPQSAGSVTILRVPTPKQRHNNRLKKKDRDIHTSVKTAQLASRALSVHL